MDSTQQAYEKKIDALKSRLTRTIKEKEEIERRRSFEVEGLMNDIISLKKQIAILENQLFQIGPMANIELDLLNKSKFFSIRTSRIDKLNILSTSH
jgi:predicted RNase H-like nuclease (RuvC/YqgF family)